MMLLVRRKMLKAEGYITFGLVVLIWIIQILHYPSFRFIDKSSFREFCLFHQNRITYIVMPLMVGELILSLYRAFHMRSFLSYLNLSIVILIWLSTAFIQVPIHQKLTQDFSPELVNDLVQTNWLRTILWSFKFILFLVLL